MPQRSYINIQTNDYQIEREQIQELKESLLSPDC
jgi:hypothetical protein